MTRIKAATLATLAIALAATPVASALAGGNGWHHHGKRHYHYANPLYPVVGLTAAVVGTAAAIVTLPFAALGAAARAPAYYSPPPGSQNYYPLQANNARGYGPPPAYYPPAYYPPAASYSHVPPAASYPPPRAPYYAPRPPQYGNYDGYRGNRNYQANAGYGYYGQDDGALGDGYHAPGQRPYGGPNADHSSYRSPNQR